MSVELHPHIGPKEILKTCWWHFVVIGIIVSIPTRHAAPNLAVLSAAWCYWQFRHNLFLLITLGCLLPFFGYMWADMYGYLHLENGILERRWKWKRSRASNRIDLKAMKRCKIERTVLTRGRGTDDFYGFTFEPRSSNPLEEEIRVTMPLGNTDAAEAQFLAAIEAEMKERR